MEKMAKYVYLSDNYNCTPHYLGLSLLAIPYHSNGTFYWVSSIYAIWIAAHCIIRFFFTNPFQRQFCVNPCWRMFVLLNMNKYIKCVLLNMYVLLNMNSKHKLLFFFLRRAHCGACGARTSKLCVISILTNKLSYPATPQNINYF